LRRVSADDQKDASDLDAAATALRDVTKPLMENAE
jgi:hypothetical protein